MGPLGEVGLSLRNLAGHELLIARVGAQEMRVGKRIQAPASLRAWRQRPGGLAFAAHLEVSPSTLSQLNGSRNMGDKMAAQIERHAGKAPGWIDVEHPGVMSTPGESAFVELSGLAWRATDAKGAQVADATCKV